MSISAALRRARRAVSAPVEFTVTRDGLWFLYPARDRLGRRLAAAGYRVEMDVVADVTQQTGCTGTIVDVGANIGTTTIPALALHGFNRAVCIEPHPLNAKLLRANLALNDLTDRAVVVEAAAADTCGEAMLRESRVNSGAHMLSAKGLMHVRVVTIDSLDVRPGLFVARHSGRRG